MTDLVTSTSTPAKLFNIMYHQQMAGSRVVGLDWLRGLAALWVVLHHVDITIQKAKYFDAPSMGVFAEAGYRGVELFFVLSGFVMAASTPVNARFDFGGMGRFLTRRVLRIFPAYLCVFLALYLVAVFTGQGAPESGMVGTFVASWIVYRSIKGPFINLAQYITSNRFPR
ncbi:MAG: acyltransferase [Sphingorhabdus sp.]